MMQCKFITKDGKTFLFPRKPEDKVPVNTGRRIAKIFVPGMGEIVQDMGPVADTITFNGILAGDDAEATLVELRKLSIRGEPLTFQLGGFTRTVLIENLNFEIIQRGPMKYRYEISLVVVENLEITQEKKNQLLGRK